jgi:hypothetical protein
VALLMPESDHNRQIGMFQVRMPYCWVCMYVFWISVN